jgi:hypothetical protein
MSDSNAGRWVGVCVGLLVGAGAVAAFFWLRERPSAVPPASDAGAPLPVDAGAAPPPPEAPPLDEGEIPPAAALAPSDEELRGLLGRLSKDASIWLENEGILDRLVAAVEAVARGDSPRKLVPFLAPEGRFLILERDGKTFIDPACYERYDRIALAFTSLDTAAVAEQYRNLGRWLRRAHRNLGVPDRTLHKALVEGFTELLEVPVFSGDVPLTGTSVNMKMDLPELEAMSEAQKHLFRMGPVNVRRVQVKLRELGVALGIGAELERVKPVEVPSPAPASP